MDYIILVYDKREKVFPCCEGRGVFQLPEGQVEVKTGEQVPF